jgi:DNA-binding NtrC family response regulator
MTRTLYSWIGFTDLRASEHDAAAGMGPIAQAVKSLHFDRVILLGDFEKSISAEYVEWLADVSGVAARLFNVKLSGPTRFGEIYQCASDIVSKTLNADEKPDLTFHLSPGTPAMAAVWIILAKTRFPATLIESSREHGVNVASVPFDISADFIPDLLLQRDRDLQESAARISMEAPEFSDIISRSPEMKRIVAMARRIAPRSFPVLIEGESGTGKELLARAIHRASLRRNKPFVAVNCGAIPSDLVESELFGHEKGAFTGALSSRKGYFEEAHQGTLFLDEIGELPLPAQVKLLRALQEMEITRVGSAISRQVDVRIIAATNSKLPLEVAAGRFREDLYYRLSVAVLDLPPLRGRQGDISLLIDHFLRQVNETSANEAGFRQKEISAAGKNLLLQHRWPGNIRELYNTILRAAIWSDGNSIDAAEIRASLMPSQPPESENVLNQPLGGGFNLQEMLAIVARHYLERALREANGNKTRAAELVGLPSYQTLTNWLKKFHLET